MDDITHIILLIYLKIHPENPPSRAIENTWGGGGSKGDHSEFLNALLLEKTLQDFRSQVEGHIQQARNTLPEYNTNINAECVLCSQGDRAEQRNHILSCT